MTFTNQSAEVAIPFFIHYKNKPYRYHGVVKHSETLEELVHYETLYENKEGAFWVRPKQMFFENHSTGVERFKQQHLQLDLVWDPSHDVLESAFELGLKIFADENTSNTVNRSELKTKWFEKAKSQKNLCVLTAKIKGSGNIVGFKVGFQIEDNEFYTWLGAVERQYRNLSIAKEMQLFFEKSLAASGFKSLKTKSNPQWTEQMCANLKNGFRIISVNDQQEVLFQKFL